MLTVSINLYSFNELNEAAKEFAVNDYANFLEEIGNEYEDENGVMQTDYSRPDEETTIETIEANEYLFFEDGTMASITHYCGKHEKAGITEFKFKGRVYDITNSLVS